MEFFLTYLNDLDYFKYYFFLILNEGKLISLNFEIIIVEER